MISQCHQIIHTLHPVLNVPSSSQCCVQHWKHERSLGTRLGLLVCTPQAPLILAMYHSIIFIATATNLDADVLLWYYYAWSLQQLPLPIIATCTYTHIDNRNEAYVLYNCKPWRFFKILNILWCSMYTKFDHIVLHKKCLSGSALPALWFITFNCTHQGLIIIELLKGNTPFMFIS